VRYKTAAILCFALIGAMFALPSIILDIFPSLNHKVVHPIPVYEEICLQIAMFCISFRWLLLLPAIGLGVSFTIVGMTRASRMRRR
jgi:type II secretory pathway component PulF